MVNFPRIYPNALEVEGTWQFSSPHFGFRNQIFSFGLAAQKRTLKRETLKLFGDKYESQQCQAMSWVWPSKTCRVSRSLQRVNLAVALFARFHANGCRENIF
jgi:hypothetical protein